MTERCPDCDRILATDRDHEIIPEGEGEHLCWRRFHGGKCYEPHDWRGEALALREQLERVRGALAALVGKLEAVSASPAYMGVWSLYQAHRGRYTGPTYEAEMQKALAILNGDTDD